MLDLRRFLSIFYYLCGMRNVVRVKKEGFTVELFRSVSLAAESAGINRFRFTRLLNSCGKIESGGWVYVYLSQ